MDFVLQFKGNEAAAKRYDSALFKWSMFSDATIVLAESLPTSFTFWSVWTIPLKRMTN